MVPDLDQQSQRLGAKFTRRSLEPADCRDIAVEHADKVSQWVLTSWGIRRRRVEIQIRKLPVGSLWGDRGQKIRCNTHDFLDSRRTIGWTTAAIGSSGFVTTVVAAWSSGSFGNREFASMNIQFFSCDGVSSSGPFLAPVGGKILIPNDLPHLDREALVRRLFDDLAKTCHQRLLVFDENGHCIAAEILMDAPVQIRPREMQWLDMPLAYQRAAAAGRNRTLP